MTATTTSKMSGHRVLVASLASTLLFGIGACDGDQVAVESAVQSPHPQDSDEQGQPDSGALTVTYDVYAVDEDVSQQATHEFILVAWDEWFDIVVDGDEYAAVGAWESANTTTVTSGIFHPEAAALERDGEQPATLTLPADEFELEWRSGDGSLLESSIDIHTAEADTHAVDPETGTTIVEDSDGEAPNGWMNPRFSAAEGSFDGMAAMDDLSHALGVLGSVLEGNVSDEDDLIEALAAQLDQPAESLRFVALEDVACEDCSDMVGVWDEDAQIPLVGFDITADGYAHGVVVETMAAADSSDQALLEEAAQAAEG